jgi:hypothetical protein
MHQGVVILAGNEKYLISIAPLAGITACRRGE